MQASQIYKGLTLSTPIDNLFFPFICTFHLIYFSRVRVLEVRNILVLKRNLAIVNNFNGIFLVVHISPVVWTRYNVNNNNCV